MAPAASLESFRSEAIPKGVAAILTPGFSPTVGWCATGEPVMTRPAIAFVLALAATAANAQDTRSGPSQTPAEARGNGSRPFLFDGRMPGDGSRRQRPVADDNHAGAGAIVMPPKASQPGRER